MSDDEAFAVGLACGGSIRVMVEPVGAAVPEALLEELTAAHAAGEPVAYAVDTERWDRRLLRPGDPAAGDRFAFDRSGFEGATFLAVCNPPLRLIVVGGVHIAQPFVEMARLAGWAPTVVDPREAFASPDRFPGTALLHEWPDEALETLEIDARTAVVTLTHDPKLDDPALTVALRSPALYVGALGSKRTHAKASGAARRGGAHGGRDGAAPRAHRARHRRGLSTGDRDLHPGGDDGPAEGSLMEFGPVPVAEAEGAILAHSLALPDGRLRKGTRLGATRESSGSAKPTSRP